MIKTTFWTILLILTVCAIKVLAIDGKKKHPSDPKPWSPYFCCHNLSDTPHRPGTIVEDFLVPDFYYLDTLRKGDTTFAYVCYDDRDSVINADTVEDFVNISYMSLFKSYIDYLHTYRDHGKLIPLPVSLITERYDRIADDKWTNISYPSNKYTQLQEFRDDIVRIDTFKDLDSASHITIESIYKYYRTAPLK